MVIEVIDDGRGIPRDKILAKAIAKGLVSEDQELTDNQILRLIFHPGFSTAAAPARRARPGPMGRHGHTL